MNMLRKIDLWLLLPAVLISLAGIVTMNVFEGSTFGVRHLVFLGIGLAVYFVASQCNFSFLQETRVVVFLYGIAIGLLVLLFVLGTVTKGAQSWFDLGAFSVQPSDPAKLVLIILLAKYFTRRHIEIRRLRHIVISGAYAFLLFLLVVLQPDFGSASIIFFIWLGMVIVSGVPVRYLLAIAGIGAGAATAMWFFVFEAYQKARISSFLDPFSDIQGAGYNAYQSVVAVGSGQLLGKGIGYGTQSKLAFLPEHETDFIFAAFSEEWGLIGVMLLLGLFSVLIGRLIYLGSQSKDNFKALFMFGLVVFFVVHVVINVGMNIGLLPVTGTTLPFMSYGGSHLLTEFLALGIASALATTRRRVKDMTLFE